MQHGLTEHSHGAGVPLQTRNERPRSTSINDFPEVSKLQEIWRYLPIEKLGGLDNDVYSEVSESELQLSLPEGMKVKFVESSIAPIGKAGLPEDRVAAAAWSNASRTLVVEVEESAEIDQAGFIKLSGTKSGAHALHVVVHAKKFSVATLVLDHTGQGTLGENVELILEDGAKLNFVSIQDWAKGSAHVSAQYATVGRDAELKHVVVSLGGDLVRITPSVSLNSKGGQVHMFGVYLADSGDYIEHRPYVDHIAPNCVSRVTYKGALQGKGSHTVWVGDVLIRESATGTDTYELNRNLLLTDGARADSVPNLEIETGKIEGAGHASASGRFDDEQLFYLQSRGISEHDARRLVVRGFLNEVIQKIGIEEVENRLREAIELDLERTGA
ncbi:MAG: Fe-S cluster assembly protein SufD [Actinomycetota bacterium]|jgi:Fe-S cluster assembly protein SufD